MTSDKVPLYGTLPTIPSGTSFAISSSVSWKYLSLEPSFIASTEPIPLYILNFLPSYIIVSPGDSSTPANIEPSITESAPAAIALTISPV